MKFIKSLLPYIIIIIVVVLIRSFIATPVSVKGNSMYPTLEGDEIMILNKLGKIDRYDIVVVHLDNKNDNLIKRVIALPGEKIKIENSKIYINGEEIPDEFGYGETYNIDEVELNEDEYYILGDNRIISLDSRVFGKINKKNIKGTASLAIFPFNKFGKVK